MIRVGLLVLYAFISVVGALSLPPVPAPTLTVAPTHVPVPTVSLPLPTPTAVVVVVPTPTPLALPLPTPTLPVVVVPTPTLQILVTRTADIGQDPCTYPPETWQACEITRDFTIAQLVARYESDPVGNPGCASTSQIANGYVKVMSYPIVLLMGDNAWQKLFAGCNTNNDAWLCSDEMTYACDCLDSCRKTTYAYIQALEDTAPS